MKRFIVLFLLALACFSGCARLKAAQDADNEYRAANRLVSEKKYSEAAAAYDQIAKESAGTERGENALFAAASAQASYDNPHKDYAQALQSFDEFLKLYPESGKAQEAQNWHYFIKTILDLRKENERLTSSIEQLKKLDIRHEERRRK